MTIHRLKVWLQFTPALEDGSKNFEVRKDDRNFQVGDTLDLHGFDPVTHSETDWNQVRTVTYKMSGPAFGVSDGYCVLGLSLLITATYAHDAGAVACCSGCGRYTNSHRALLNKVSLCDCVKVPPVLQGEVYESYDGARA